MNELNQNVSKPRILTFVNRLSKWMKPVAKLIVLYFLATWIFNTSIDASFNNGVSFSFRSCSLTSIILESCDSSNK